MFAIAAATSSCVGPSFAMRAISPSISLVVATASLLRVNVDATNEPLSRLRSNAELAPYVLAPSTRTTFISRDVKPPPPST